ncbi:MAG TPA: response regulator [Candidatus Omnitrophota bacterium]|nr:response regulator [Candidatus Omnitrophota bacterium]
MARTVLIVDDDALTLRLLRARLKSAGYEVVEAQSGEQAIKEAAEREIDAVVMDIMLPDMDGAEVVSVLKQQQNFKRTRVVFLSGIVSGQEEGGSELLVGGENFPAIGKPVDVERLLELLEG